MSVAEADKFVVVRADLDVIFPVLGRLGYEIIGPTLRDGAIVYDTIESTRELPSGWTDEQAPGSYRLRPSGDNSLFAFANGSQPWKRFLYEPTTRLLQIHAKDGAGWTIVSDDKPARKMAFFGVRACDLHALSVLDRVLVKGKFTDAAYEKARANVFIVAVNCAHPGGNCFCASMNAGPRCPDGFDLVLTEITQGEHRFVVEAGTAAGRKVLKELARKPATEADLEFAEEVHNQARAAIRKTLDTRGLKQLLFACIEQPVWERIAKRCLACANCTMSCPTCFCSTVEESCDLTGQCAERWRYWDSCFSQQYSYIHGGSVRNSVSARYRHWMLHKLASWWDQFGTSGCVGCGRCITWCPVGIDIVEEVRNIRESTRGGMQ